MDFDKLEADRKEKYRQRRQRWYALHKEEQIARAAGNTLKMKEYAREAKKVPCADCEVSYPYYVMDFDHRDPSTKRANISLLVTKGNLEILKEEIAKCDVVCANCHRQRTHG